MVESPLRRVALLLVQMVLMTVLVTLLSRKSQLYDP